MIMMDNQMRKGYLWVAFFSIGASLVALIVIGANLLIPGVGRRISSQEEEIITRTGILVGTENTKGIWTEELESNLLTLSDYVRISLTGSEYLLKNPSDETFARDLAFIVFGSPAESEEILRMLDGRSRKYVIEKVLSDMNRKYAPSQGFSPEIGTQLVSFHADNPIQDENGYAFGLRKISGSIDMEGTEARTDFFVDDTLRPGNLILETDASGGQIFSMIWDARGESPGMRNVKVLLRTSDGRGEVITGGQVIIPPFTVVENDGVLKSKVAERENLAWYTLDAGDRDAYINFINITGDVRVILYNLYGDIIGANDLHGYPHETLRGVRQPKLLSEMISSGPLGTQNVFYACVERSPEASPSVIDIDYTVVCSKNVAIHRDGRVLSVIDEIGNVPTPIPFRPASDEGDEEPILCANENGEKIAFAREDLSFVPLNGVLTAISLRSGEGGKTYRAYPDHDVLNRDYAYVFDEETDEISLRIVPAEGYAAKISVSNLSKANALMTPQSDGPIRLVSGENTISIRVVSFDGTESEYRMFILNKVDETEFGESVLTQFPSGYRSGLWLLHNLFPDYRFLPYQTGIDWEELVSNQDYKGTSLANAISHPHWVKPDSIVYDGSGWKAAKRQVVEYFLDPRNFLTPVYVFQFEKLSFDATVHSAEGIRHMVSDSFLDENDIGYPRILFEAGSEAGISPYFLTSRILQEMGRQGNSKLASGTLEGYEGYYNFYNIGSTPNPQVIDGALINGARFSQWGRNPDERELTEDELAILLPWTTPEKAIKGGALWIASSYIDIGQNTLYFQKFDVIDNEDGLYRHQYAQNISMAYSESSRYFHTYLSQDMLGSPFLFIIPVYDKMPVHYGVFPEK